MKLTCPQCNQEYEVDEALVGSRVECETCGEKFTCGPHNSAAFRGEDVEGREAPPSSGRPQVDRRWKHVAIASLALVGLLVVRDLSSRSRAGKVQHPYPAQPITAGAALDIFANDIFKSFAPKNTMTDLAPQPPYKSREEAYYYGAYLTDVKATFRVWVDKREEHDRPSRFIYFAVSADKNENPEARDTTKDLFWTFVMPFTELAIENRDDLFGQFTNLEGTPYKELGEDLRSRKVGEIHGHYRFSLEEVDRLSDDYSGKRELEFRYLIDLL